MLNVFPLLFAILPPLLLLLLLITVASNRSPFSLLTLMTGLSHYIHLRRFDKDFAPTRFNGSKDQCEGQWEARAAEHVEETAVPGCLHTDTLWNAMPQLTGTGKSINCAATRLRRQGLVGTLPERREAL